MVQNMEEKQEIRSEDIFNLNFYTYKKPFTGSFRGMRYRIIMTEENEEKKLCATVWPEPFSFEATPKESMESRFFEFSERGRLKVVSWLNEKFENFS